MSFPRRDAEAQRKRRLVLTASSLEPPWWGRLQPANPSEPRTLSILSSLRWPVTATPQTWGLTGVSQGAAFAPRGHPGLSPVLPHALKSRPPRPPMNTLIRNGKVVTATDTIA